MTEVFVLCSLLTGIHHHRKYTLDKLITTEKNKKAIGQQKEKAEQRQAKRIAVHKHTDMPELF